MLEWKKYSILSLTVGLMATINWSRGVKIHCHNFFFVGRNFRGAGWLINSVAFCLYKVDVEMTGLKNWRGNELVLIHLIIRYKSIKTLKLCIIISTILVSESGFKMVYVYWMRCTLEFIHAKDMLMVSSCTTTCSLVFAVSVCLSPSRGVFRGHSYVEKTSPLWMFLFKLSVRWNLQSELNEVAFFVYSGEKMRSCAAGMELLRSTRP